jgi:predicted transcriptional regulator
MANLTLKIDDDLLEKARRLAAKRKTSVNAIVKANLEAFVSSDLVREATLRGLDEFYAHSKAKLGKKTWSREDLHER